MRDTDFSKAILVSADLSRVDLRGATLRDADLRGADLSGAIVSQEQLEQAKSLEGAILPDGTATYTQVN